MDPVAILIWLVIGGVAGWLAGQVMRGAGFGLLGNIIVGIVGAVLGGAIFGALGITFGGILGSLLGAFLGACILLFLISLVKRA
ncbi:GlsB/YeaQ/YmgE family stress response membrane protein [Henriciella aquimarina]|uniref:GlsB/YeaQ/YmgE family stress response membrane protein n=1 Tax=Henriciella aquimarina TaxID=545261 RepID=UPI0009FEE39F|nr:GlsB/YeaQ/YmgE family stress response membrane protein [Henriciella aquimarina]